MRSNFISDELELNLNEIEFDCRLIDLASVSRVDECESDRILNPFVFLYLFLLVLSHELNTPNATPNTAPITTPSSHSELTNCHHSTVGSSRVIVLAFQQYVHFPISSLEAPDLFH